MDSFQNKIMQQVIDLSMLNVANGGGPFAAAIVCNDSIIALEANRVTLDNDPTAHAEILAIRSASNYLKKFDLSDCILYTSCEPCPMCLGAIYWARITKVYYCNSKNDAKKIGFDDSFIYDEICKDVSYRTVDCIHINNPYALSAFDLWEKTSDKITY